MFQRIEVVPKKSMGTKRCRQTGKIQYETATEAIELLRRWRQRDSDVCWDAKRMRVYRCEDCHKFHLGRYHG